jgi:anti-sigma B factor antagonist
LRSLNNVARIIAREYAVCDVPVLAGSDPRSFGVEILLTRTRRTAMSLTLDLEQEQPTWLLTLSGDLDYGECSTLRMNIDRILKASPPSTIVDLSGLEYLDSSGLGLLLSLSKEYGAQGGMLVLVTNETVDNILSLTRLNGIFATAASVPEAEQIVGNA